MLTNLKDSKVTIYDVASEANVSLATVSRVLNYPEKVKPETRERVLEAINRLGYRPNAIARGLASRKSTTVALIVPDVSRASVAEMINGVTDIARKYDYTVILKVTNAEQAIEDDVWQEVYASQVDGIIYLNDELTEQNIEQIRKSDVPVVLCNTTDENNVVPSVSIDFEAAFYNGTKSFIEKGRKDILLVSTRSAFSVNALKERGYVKAIEEAGLKSNIVRTSGRLAVNYPFFQEYFKDNHPEVVIAVRDSIGASLINAVSDLGIKIPEELEVLGFQNTKISKMSRPTLSTIDNPIYDIGAVSMRLLTKLMNDEEEVENVNVILPHDIIWRNSTK
ncbi:MAG: ccpA [Haloplasmataceae bacterium]|jgi:LacI family transcriptional regulator|nr:ccpA [Haloplasmataceae bacterium]